MRSRLLIGFALPLFAVIAGVPVTARAQGFFDQLFSFGSSYRTPNYNPYRAPAPRPRSESLEAGTGYRTLCVRLCDGYYFPISFSASLGRLGNDANVCRASCGEESRLFYLENNNDDIASMVDQSGRAYSNLPNAFRYRQTRVEGCSCKPDPWAQSELDRHKGYAARSTSADKSSATGAKPSSRLTPSDPAVARALAASPEQAAARHSPPPVQQPAPDSIDP